MALKSADEYRKLAGGDASKALALMVEDMKALKKDKKKLGVLQFGTEAVAAADGSISFRYARQST